MSNDYSKIKEQLAKHGTVQGIMKYINYENLKRQHERQEKNKANEEIPI